MNKRSLMYDTNLIYFILITFFIAIRIFTSIFSISSALGSVLNIALQILVMFGIPFVLYQVFRKRTAKQTFADFKFNKISFKAVLISIIIGILVFIINIAVASFFNTVITLIGYDPNFGIIGSTGGSERPMSFATFLLNVFMTAVLPGFCEEFAHRGLLLNGYKNYGAKKAIIFSGLLFGLMHLNIEQCFYATIIGLFLGLLAVSTDNIFPCIIVHFMNNFISVYLSFAKSNGYFGGNFSEVLTSWLSGNSIFLTLLIIFIVLCVLIAALIFLVMLLLKETKIKKITDFANTLFKQKLRDDLLEEDGTTENNAETNQEPQVQINPVANSSMPLAKVLLPQNLIYSGFVKGEVTLKDKIFMYEIGG